MQLKSEMEMIQHNSIQAIIEYHHFKHFKKYYIHMYNKTGSVYSNVTLRRVRVTIVAEANQ
jgi:hypothetical protein